MNKDIKTAIQNAFYESTKVYANSEPSGEPILMIDDLENAEKIVLIEDCASRVVQSKERLFSPATGDDYGDMAPTALRTRLGDRVLSLVRDCNFAEVFKSFTTHRFHPAAESFIRHFRARQLEKLGGLCLSEGGGLKGHSGLLNGFIDGIRTEAQSERFKMAVRNHESGVSNSHKRLVDDIISLSLQHPRLCAAMAYLGYGKEDSHPVEPERLMRHLREHHTKATGHYSLFLNHMRSNPLLEQWVGSAHKLEFGRLRGFYLQVLFLFDGSKVGDDVETGRVIGECWKAATDGEGIYCNCNALTGRDKYRGVGMVDRDGTGPTDSLIEWLAGCLTWPDYYAKISDEGMRQGRGWEMSLNSARLL